MQRKGEKHTFCEWKWIGAGGCGDVYRVPRENRDGFWAVKVIPIPRTEDKEVILREALEEARLQSRLRGKGIVCVREVRLGERELFWYMDYAAGDSLLARLEQEGAFSESRAIQTGIQICRLLRRMHCHRPQIVYRDVKPGNFLMDSKGRLQLADFGTAWVFGRGSRRDFLPLGTAGYAAPEQYEKGAVLDARTDVYALGMLLMELLTGERPWEQKSVEEWMKRWEKTISASLLEIIETCTKKNPGERYPSCRDVKQALVLAGREKKQSDRRTPKKGGTSG